METERLLGKEDVVSSIRLERVAFAGWPEHVTARSPTFRSDECGLAVNRPAVLGRRPIPNVVVFTEAS